MNDTASDFQKTKELTEKYVLDLVNRYPVAFRYGVNELLFDQSNKQYIDFLCGVAVTNLGHSDPDIIEVMRDQIDRIIHTSNWFYSEEGSRLAELLIQNTFPGKVFLCNSGTEATEAAFKLARAYAEQKQIHDPIIISLHKSFHGRSVSGISLTGQKKMHTGFGKLLDGIEFVAPNSEEELAGAFDKFSGRIVALIVEPILGESGIYPLSHGYMNLARELTAENEALLILDEIQTGFGRTGTMFAFETYGFSPDVMTLAKGLGSGYPIGAMIVAEKFQNVLGKGSHGTTFGGNPLGAAVAYETIRLIHSRDLLSNVNLCSEIAFSRLAQLKQKLKIVKEVRGKGLHIGIDLKIPSRPVAEACLEKGLIVNATGDTVIRVMPPLTISTHYLNEGLDILENVLVEFQNQQK